MLTIKDLLQKSEQEATAQNRSFYKIEMQDKITSFLKAIYTPSFIPDDAWIYLSDQEIEFNTHSPDLLAKLVKFFSLLQEYEIIEFRVFVGTPRITSINLSIQIKDLPKQLMVDISTLALSKLQIDDLPQENAIPVEKTPNPNSNEKQKHYLTDQKSFPVEKKIKTSQGPLDSASDTKLTRVPEKLQNLIKLNLKEEIGLIMSLVIYFYFDNIHIKFNSQSEIPDDEKEILEKKIDSLKSKSVIKQFTKGNNSYKKNDISFNINTCDIDLAYFTLPRKYTQDELKVILPDLFPITMLTYNNYFSFNNIIKNIANIDGREFHFCISNLSQKDVENISQLLFKSQRIGIEPFSDYLFSENQGTYMLLVGQVNWFELYLFKMELLHLQQLPIVQIEDRILQFSESTDDKIRYFDIVSKDPLLNQGKPCQSILAVVTKHITKEKETSFKNKYRLSKLSHAEKDTLLNIIDTKNINFNAVVRDISEIINFMETSPENFQESELYQIAEFLINYSLSKKKPVEYIHFVQHALLFASAYSYQAAEHVLICFITQFLGVRELDPIDQKNIKRIFSEFAEPYFINNSILDLIKFYNNLLNFLGKKSYLVEVLTTLNKPCWKLMFQEGLIFIAFRKDGAEDLLTEMCSMKDNQCIFRIGSQTDTVVATYFDNDGKFEHFLFPSDSSLSAEWIKSYLPWKVYSKSEKAFIQKSITGNHHWVAPEVYFTKNSISTPFAAEVVLIYPEKDHLTILENVPIKIRLDIINEIAKNIANNASLLNIFRSLLKAINLRVLPQNIKNFIIKFDNETLTPSEEEIVQLCTIIKFYGLDYSIFSEKLANSSLNQLNQDIKSKNVNISPQNKISDIIKSINTPLFCSDINLSLYQSDFFKIAFFLVYLSLPYTTIDLDYFKIQSNSSIKDEQLKTRQTLWGFAVFFAAFEGKIEAVEDILIYILFKYYGLKNLSQLEIESLRNKVRGSFGKTKDSNNTEVFFTNFIDKINAWLNSYFFIALITLNKVYDLLKHGDLTLFVETNDISEIHNIINPGNDKKECIFRLGSQPDTLVITYFSSVENKLEHFLFPSDKKLSSELSSKVVSGYLPPPSKLQ